MSRIPYNFFMEQVQDGDVAQISVGENLIRYQLKEGTEQAEQTFAKTPIVDLELPNLLEAQGVEFTVTPSQANC